jgi:type IV secretion system protein VirB10
MTHDPAASVATASPDLGEDDDFGAAVRPSVAGPATRGGPFLIAGAAALLGLGAFMVLTHQRSSAAPDHGVAAPAGPAPISAAPPPDLAAFEASARAARLAVPAPPAASERLAPFSLATPAPILAATPTAPNADHLRAPTLVVDFSLSEPRAAAAPAPSTPSTKSAPNALNADEQFAERVGSGETDTARATPMADPQAMIAQGVVIPAVLETAMNSDLPGFARAVVSRDVRSFDGSRVLIPRGSRAIGQYRSAVAQGQSRVFVIWTRLQRPDGATIQIASPATDPLGRAGLEGQVDRHFFQQFGGSILLSVIDGAVAGLSDHSGAQVVIGSAQDATALGAGALRPATLSPTIRTPQGAPIRIFVARDLDFSAVPDHRP